MEIIWFRFAVETVMMAATCCGATRLVVVAVLGSEDVNLEWYAVHAALAAVKWGWGGCNNVQRTTWHAAMAHRTRWYDAVFLLLFEKKPVHGSGSTSDVVAVAAAGIFRNAGTGRLLLPKLASAVARACRRMRRPFSLLGLHRSPAREQTHHPIMLCRDAGATRNSATTVGNNWG
jgi:hypothetical protein